MLRFIPWHGERVTPGASQLWGFLLEGMPRIGRSFALIMSLRDATMRGFCGVTLVTEADSGSNETEGAVFTTNRGVTPRPIRKRGFHRALKRGEPWAMIEESLSRMRSALNNLMYKSMLLDNPIKGLLSFLEADKIEKP